MLAAVSIDLDEIACYAAIHGLSAPPNAAAHAIYERAVPRFERWFDRLGIRATFFAIGRDLERTRAAATLARISAAGHEIGNHTFHHRYDLTRQNADAIDDDIARGESIIESVTGARPRGFRAPGYTICDELFALLSARRYTYDSSVFPCPAYYGLKALAMGAIRLRGRRSRSILDDPRVLTAPADPYRVGRPYRRRGKGLLELPIGVTSDGSGRLPFIGTNLALAGERGARWFARRVAGRPLVNLELHGIDLCDAERDGLDFLAPHQRDLRRSVDEKHAALDAAIDELRRHGYRFVTLEQAAQHFA